jgi:hypothetical protein
MSGQTIEVLNTDAEGRMVLGDCLWYAQERFKPKAVINLATLTGAVMVALGKEHAGLFSNNDELSAWLTEAGNVTGEKLWRLPLGPKYDKMIDSKVADMKNTGGKWGGSISAAQFLQRFIKDVVSRQRDQSQLGFGLRRSSARPSHQRSLRAALSVRACSNPIAAKFSIIYLMRISYFAVVPRHVGYLSGEKGKSWLGARDFSGRR